MQCIMHAALDKWRESDERVRNIEFCTVVRSLQLSALLLLPR
jgi:hypothetical protein